VSFGKSLESCGEITLGSRAKFVYQACITIYEFSYAIIQSGWLQTNIEETAGNPISIQRSVAIGI